jgi:hypothetical protein
MNFLAIVNLAMLVMTALPAAIQAAESIFGAVKGQGTVKKDLVLGTVQAGLDAAVAAGDKHAADPGTQAAVLKFAGTAIDSIVGTFNAINGWLKPAPASVPAPPAPAAK